VRPPGAAGAPIPPFRPSTPFLLLRQPCALSCAGLPGLQQQQLQLQQQALLLPSQPGSPTHLQQARFASAPTSPRRPADLQLPPGAELLRHSWGNPSPLAGQAALAAAAAAAQLCAPELQQQLGNASAPNSPRGQLAVAAAAARAGAGAAAVAGAPPQRQLLQRPSAAATPRDEASLASISTTAASLEGGVAPAGQQQRQQQQVAGRRRTWDMPPPAAAGAGAQQAQRGAAAALSEAFSRLVSQARDLGLAQAEQQAGAAAAGGSAPAASEGEAEAEAEALLRRWQRLELRVASRPGSRQPSAAASPRAATQQAPGSGSPAGSSPRSPRAVAAAGAPEQPGQWAGQTPVMVKAFKTLQRAYELLSEERPAAAGAAAGHAQGAQPRAASSRAAAAAWAGTGREASAASLRSSLASEASTLADVLSLLSPDNPAPSAAALQAARAQQQQGAGEGEAQEGEAGETPKGRLASEVAGLIATSAAISRQRSVALEELGSVLDRVRSIRSELAGAEQPGPAAVAAAATGAASFAAEAAQEAEAELAEEDGGAEAEAEAGALEQRQEAEQAALLWQLEQLARGAGGPAQAPRGAEPAQAAAPPAGHAPSPGSSPSRQQAGLAGSAHSSPKPASSLRQQPAGPASSVPASLKHHYQRPMMHSASAPASPRQQQWASLPASAPASPRRCDRSVVQQLLLGAGEAGQQQQQLHGAAATIAAEALEAAGEAEADDDFAQLMRLSRKLEEIASRCGSWPGGSGRWGLRGACCSGPACPGPGLAGLACPCEARCCRCRRLVAGVAVPPARRLTRLLRHSAHPSLQVWRAAGRLRGHVRRSRQRPPQRPGRQQLRQGGARPPARAALAGAATADAVPADEPVVRVAGGGRLGRRHGEAGATRAGSAGRGRSGGRWRRRQLVVPQPGRQRQGAAAGALGG
jgi:hypothetical protein